MHALLFGIHVYSLLSLVSPLSFLSPFFPFSLLSLTPQGIWESRQLCYDSATEEPVACLSEVCAESSLEC